MVDNLIQAIIVKMVLMVEQLMEMVVVEHLQGHLVEQEMVLDIMEVLAHQVDHQDLDLEVEAVPVVSVVMDLTLDKLQPLEVKEHQIAF